MAKGPLKHTKPDGTAVAPMPAHVIEMMKNATPANAKEEPHELPQWVKLALVKHRVEDSTYKEVAKEFNRAGETLRKYAQSPAAAKWLATLNDFLEDPVVMAKAIMAANAHHVALDRFMFLHAAKEAGDYIAGDKIARDIQDRQGVVAKKQETGAISVKINLGGVPLDVPAIEAEWEMLGGEEEDEEDV